MAEIWRQRRDSAHTEPEKAQAEEAQRRTEESARDGLRRKGISALSYFKSEENIALLRPLLKDEVTMRTTSDGVRFTEVYMTRQAAYEVLHNWGVDVPQPVTVNGLAR